MAKPANREKLPVLIILHQEHSTPGRVGRLLRERGHALDIRRPRFGDALPDTMAEHAGAVIFGGPMSANDEDDFIKREIDWIEVPLKEERPYLGLCLGAQMMARLLGARVYAHPDGRAEIGYFPLLPTPDGVAVAERLGARLAEPRLSLASRGLRMPGRRDDARDRRPLPDPGDPGRAQGLRAAVPPGGHARHDVPVDGPGGAPARASGRPGPLAPDRGSFHVRPARGVLGSTLSSTTGSARRSSLPRARPAGRCERTRGRLCEPTSPDQPCCLSAMRSSAARS